MDKALTTLDKCIAGLRPDYYAQLRDPLSDEMIAALEHEYGVTIPPGLKALYQWKDGQQDLCFEAFVNNSGFLPLQQALDISRESTGMIGFDFEIENWWHPAWIPLFHNGGGDYICYDNHGLFTGLPGQLIEFWHADNDRNVIAPSLELFIRQLNHYYETTAPSAFDEFFTLEQSPPGYPKKFYLPS